MSHEQISFLKCVFNSAVWPSILLLITNICYLSHRIGLNYHCQNYPCPYLGRSQEVSGFSDTLPTADEAAFGFRSILQSMYLFYHKKFTLLDRSVGNGNGFHFPSRNCILIHQKVTLTLIMWKLKIKIDSQA